MITGIINNISHISYKYFIDAVPAIYQIAIMEYLGSETKSTYVLSEALFHKIFNISLPSFFTFSNLESITLPCLQRASALSFKTVIRELKL